MPLVWLFFVSAAFSVVGAFNRFSAAPLLCAFLIPGYPALGGSVLPDKVPILITLITEVLAFGVALRHYVRLRCIDAELVRRFAVPAGLAAAAGSLLAHTIAGSFRGHLRRLVAADGATYVYVRVHHDRRRKDA